MDLKINTHRVIWLLKNSAQFGYPCVEYDCCADEDTIIERTLLSPAPVPQETMDAWLELLERLGKTGRDGITLWQECNRDTDSHIYDKCTLAYVSGVRKKRSYWDFKKQREYLRGNKLGDLPDIDKEEKQYLERRWGRKIITQEDEWQKRKQWVNELGKGIDTLQ